MQTPQILAVFQPHAPGDQENCGMAGACCTDKATIVEQKLDPVAHLFASRDEDRRRRLARPFPQRAHCHRNTPSRQA